MKLLVTGGCGFIGSNFIRYILDKRENWKIINIDKLTYAGNRINLSDIRENDRYSFIQGDITNIDLLKGLFQRNEFDAVVNFAAETHVDKSLENPTPFVETNIRGTQALLEVSRANWRTESEKFNFVHISTDEVYGSLGQEGNFSESSPLLPNNPYSASKASADMICKSYNKSFSFPVTILRGSNIYGPYQYPEKLIPAMINKALNDEPLTIYGKGNEVRDWLYVADYVSAVEKVLENNPSGEVYNVGGGQERKNIEVVRRIKKTLKENSSIEHVDPEILFIKDPRGEAHDFRYALDYTKINRELSWQPKIDFETGLADTVNWYVENRDWIDKVID